MHTIITFLGLFPKQTEYQHQEKVYTGEVFAQALRQFCQFDRMLVCVTPEARERTLPLLTALNDPRIEPVDIPRGETTAEMWETFNAIAQRVQPKDQVTFDITHGLRSLPFLVFLFAAYLKAAKQVSIVAIYYGAFDLGKGKPAPVIDLSEFVSLLDWTTATDQFIKTGNGQALACLLEQEGDSTAKELAQGINAIAEGLQLLRPTTVMQQSAKLPALIQAATSTIYQSAPPFSALLSRVEEDYAAFGLEDSANYKLNAQAALICQLKMIEWYVEKEQIVQALSMAREWLPSLLCYHFELDPQIENPNRSEMELLLAGGKFKNKETGETTKESRYLEEWKELPDARKKPLTRLWGGDLNLANLRNDVLHAGFRKNPRAPEAILERTRKVVDELKQIARAWELEK